MRQTADLISRQAAIDALWQAEKELPYYDGAQVSVNVIKNLPSAQPEIIRCRDCECYDMVTEHCTNDKGLRFIDYSNPDGMWCSWAERRTDGSN